MPEVSQLKIQPPLAGVIRSRGFQAQPPFSLRQAINYWPQYALEGTELLATRPPLGAWDEPATTGAVNLAQRVNGTTSNTPQRTIVVARNGALYRWDGTAFVAITMGALSLPTNRALFATTLGQKIYIPHTTPMVYDYATNTLAAWTASSGTVPNDARVITTWLGSIVMSAVPDSPHVVSLSATNDALNWNFSASGEAAAWSSIGDEGGLISDPVTACIPTPGDSLIVSTPDSLFIWRAHPRRGGVADVLNPAIGVRGQGAWCADEKGHIFMLTNRGLSVFDGGNVTHISKERVPNELIGFDYDYLDPRVAMGYDVTFDKIHITVRDDTSETAWSYDLKHGGLWQQEYEAALPYVMARFDPVGTARASDLLFCGADGIYRHDLDGTENFPRHRAVIGPVRLSQDAMGRSKISEAQFVFGGGTNDTTAEVALYGGRTADSAYAAATSGLTPVKHVTNIEDIFKSRGTRRPNIADHAACLVINQTVAVANPVVVLEEVNLNLTPAGKAHGSIFHSDTSGPLAGSFQFKYISGLVAYWAMEETGSSDRQDSHTNNYDLPATGFGTHSFGTEAGINGNAALLTAGDTGSAELRNGAILDDHFNVANGFTFAAWVKFPPDVHIEEAVLLGFQGDGSPQYIFTISLQDAVLVPSNGAMKFDTSNGVVALNLPAAIDSNRHLYVVWYNPTTGKVGVRMDGTEVAEQSITAPSSGGDVSFQTTLASITGVGGEATISIDEAALWNKVLTSGQRSGLYNNGNGKFYADF